MDENQIIESVKQVVYNPLFQIGAALVIVKIIPNSLLAKIPIVGSTVQAFVNAWANKKLNDFDFQRDVMERESDRVVRSREQDIKNGKIDQSTAKIQATQHLISVFDIEPKLASELVESSVNKLPKNLELVTGEVLESDWKNSDDTK